MEAASRSSWRIAAGRWVSVLVRPTRLPSRSRMYKAQLGRGRRLARALKAGEQDHGGRLVPEVQLRTAPRPASRSAAREGCG